jgi:cysteine synthase A
MIYQNVLECIGHTPVVLLEERNGNAIYLKLEMSNPGMSIKDRIAKEMIEDLLKEGKLGKAGQKAVEGTSGNTGIGLSLVCAYYGIPLSVVMPENMSLERINLMKAYGTTVILTPKEEGMAGAEKKAAEMAKEGYVFLNQFENKSNLKAHERGTSKEIIADFKDGLDYFVAGVGTAGTLIGNAKSLKKHFPHIGIVGVEPLESPILEGGKPGPHKIQGIGANFVPPLYDKTLVDRLIAVKSEDALLKVRALAQKGYFLGISSGAAILAAEKLADENVNKSLRILAISPDGGIKYMSMGIYGRE